MSRAIPVGQYMFLDVSTLLTIARGLMEHHASEFGIADLDMYLPRVELQSLDEQGLLVTAAARYVDEWVGYIAWMVGRHQGLEGSVGRMGPWFVRKNFRGTGIGRGLFEFSLSGLRQKGCRWALPSLPNRRQRRTPYGIEFETTYLMEL